MSPNRSGPNLASGGPSIALDQHIVSLLITQLRKAQPGHCLRVDNVDSRRSVQLIHALRENQVDADIYLLADSSGQPPGESSRPLADPVRIAPDRAVELRNASTDRCC